MAAKKTVGVVPAAPSMETLMAMIAQLQAAQAAPAKAAPAPAPAKADPGQQVVAAATAAGCRVIRTGKSGTTPKGHAKAWVDVVIGGVRIQGNAFLTGK